MNSSVRNGAVAAASLLAVTAMAGNPEPEFTYIRVDAGPAFTQNLELKSISLGDVSVSGGGAEFKFDNGVRGSVAFGYDISDSLAVELEVGATWNPISRTDSTIYQVPILANVIYTFPLDFPVKPYIGGGIGPVVGILDDLTTDDNVTFGYQAIAGLKYELTDNIALGVAYKFLGTSDNTWVDGGFKLRFEGMMTHSVVAAIQYSF